MGGFSQVKKRLLVCLVAMIIMFASRQFLLSRNLQNVFDEMYYGHDGIFLSFLYPAKYSGFGLSDIHNSIRYMIDDSILEYADKTLVNKGDSISIIWVKNEKKLELSYITSIDDGGCDIVYDVDYYTNDNTLVIHPVRFSKDGHIVTQDFRLVLNELLLTKDDIERIFRDEFIVRLTDRWFAVNKGQSRFSKNDYGYIYIDNRLLDSIED